MKKCPLLFLAALAVVFVAAGCELDVTNPNAATEDDVLDAQSGLIGLGVGLQEYAATEFLEAVVPIPAVTSREVAVERTFANLIDLEAGGTALPNTNADVLRVWARPLRLMSMADDLIENAAEVPFSDPGTQSGLLALGRLHKAMALGSLAQHFEQAPTTTPRPGEDAGNATFLPRQEVFEAAVAELEAALTEIEDTPPSDVFDEQVRGTGLDLQNTLRAYLARYYLFAGVAGNDADHYRAAITAADAVDPAATSTYTYSVLTENPIFAAFNEGTADYAPRDTFGLQGLDPDDLRLGFYLSPADDSSAVSAFPIDELTGFFDRREASIPYYLPDEMALIRAEAHARLGEPALAVDEIDAVRTQAPEADPFGVGAGLPPYAGPDTEAALLEEIYRQRRAELFLQGLSLEDARRLGPPAPDPADPFARTRNFYPYPNQERLNNPNTPDDPAL